MDKSILNSVAKNSAIQMGQQIITWASSFALMLFLPRYLGPEKYGRLYLAEMIAAIFVVFIAYDGRFSIAKRISRRREDAAGILSNSLGFRAIFWVLSFAGMLIFSFSAGYPTPLQIIIVIFGIEMLWVSGRTVYTGTFLGFENTSYSAVSAIVERAFVAAVGIPVLIYGGEEIAIALVMAVGTLLGFIVCVRLMKRILPTLPPIDWKESRQLIREGFPFLLWTVFGIIYYRIDTVMLSFMTPEVTVGWYGAAYKFYDILSFLPSILTLSILPILSRLYGKEGNMLEVTTQKSLNFILITGVPISITVFFFARQITEFFYGIEGYGPSVINLQIFSVGVLLLYVDMIIGTAIVACDKQNALAVLSFCAIFINIGLNYFMIPMAHAKTGNGGIGAAIATIITEFFMLVAGVFILPRKIFDSGEPLIIYKSLASGLLLIASLLGLAWLLPGWHWMIHGTIGAAAYLGCLLMFRIFSPSELTIILGLIDPRNLKKLLNSGEDKAR